MTLHGLLRSMGSGTSPISLQAASSMQTDQRAVGSAKDLARRELGKQPAPRVYGYLSRGEPVPALRFFPSFLRVVRFLPLTTGELISCDTNEDRAERLEG